MGRLAITSETLTTAVAGTLEWDSKVPYFTPLGTQRGVVPGQQFYRLDSALAGANVNTAQSLFGVGVTLSSSTVYYFDCIFALNKTSGSTAHTIALGFGGTATVNNISYTNLGRLTTSSGLAGITAPDVYNFIQTTTSTVVTASSGANAAVQYIGRLSGSISVNVGGTLIPQYTLSAAPGGAYSTQPGSYFLIYPISASGSNTSVGTWA